MADNNDSDIGAFLTGFVVGGLVGAAVALILAPQSGAETREQIRMKGIELERARRRDSDRRPRQSRSGAADARARAEKMAAEAKVRAEEFAAKGRTTFDEGRAKLQEAMGSKKPAPAVPPPATASE